jgi:diketogulonate reductase-like aldo/keto reductase
MLLKPATRVPRIVLGTDKVKGLDCIDYIRQGLAAGYRKIDTAQVYENEEEIGRAIRSSGIPRAQVVVTTKIAAGFKKNPSSWQEATQSVQRSLGRLGLEYIDTFLIHHPGDDAVDPSAADRRCTTWQALEEQVKEGYVKNIGVSNFNVSQILEMRQYASIRPCVHQVEV